MVLTNEQKVVKILHSNVFVEKGCQISNAVSATYLVVIFMTVALYNGHILEVSFDRVPHHDLHQFPHFGVDLACGVHIALDTCKKCA